MGIQKNRLSEIILLSTNNNGFGQVIRIILVGKDQKTPLKELYKNEGKLLQLWEYSMVRTKTSKSWDLHSGVDVECPP